MQIEKTLDVAGLIACFQGWKRLRLSRQVDDGGRFHSGVLRHQLWDERIFENVERFVEIGSRVQRGDTGAETNPIVRHGGIINWRNPKATRP